MNQIYQVTVHGRRLESRDLRKLLAMAVAEKRSMDRRMRLSAPGFRQTYLHAGSSLTEFRTADAVSG
jgi:hypothetical protein